jgi:hypothetical protein
MATGSPGGWGRRRPGPSLGPWERDPSGGDGTGGDGRRFRTLLRWQLRIGTRNLVHELTRTFQGRIALLLLLVASPSLLRLTQGGAELARTPLDPDARVGALLVAHLVLTLCFSTALPALLLKGFAVDRQDEPLLAHPWTLPERHALRVGAAIAWTAFYLWLCFLLFFHPLVGTGTRDSTLTLLAHGMASAGYFTVVGTGIAAVTRRFGLRGRGGEERIRRLQRLLVLPFLLFFPLFVLAPTLLARRAPEILTEIGAAAPRALFLLQPPVAVVRALETGAWASAVAWSLVPTFAALICARSIWRWRHAAPAELALDLLEGGIGARAAPSRGRFGEGSGTLRGLTQVRLFWQKDVRLRGARLPAPGLRMHVAMAMAITVIAYILRQTRREALLDEAQIVALLTALPLAAIGWATMAATLGGLGREGGQMPLLLPVLSPRNLFGIKLAVGLGQTTLHAVLILAWFLFTVRVWGLPSPGSVHVGTTAIGTVLTLTLLGTALGFLLPDFKQRGTLIPGASRLGQLLFGGIAGGSIVALASGKYLLRSQGLGASGHLGITVGALAAPALLATLFAVWGTRRLSRLEP